MISLLPLISLLFFFSWKKHASDKLKFQIPLAKFDEPSIEGRIFTSSLINTLIQLRAFMMIHVIIPFTLSAGQNCT